jgi:flavin reductase (DIM6/NTAB) family NADH-FMN oxidoreductase RutF
MSTVHFYEPAAGHGLRHDPFSAIVGPRPIGWISSRSRDNVLNLAPYSFFNAFNYKPPIIGFASIGWKDTAANIDDTGEFCWNLVTHTLAEPMNASSAELASDVDEFTIAGLTPAAGRIVSVPRVAESPVSFECRRTQIIRLQTASADDTNSWLILGEVVGVHIDNRLLTDGIYQTAEANPILRAGGAGAYARIDETVMFEMRRPR